MRVFIESWEIEKQNGKRLGKTLVEGNRDVSFCLSEAEIAAMLDARGFQAGVGNFVIS